MEEYKDFSYDCGKCKTKNSIKAEWFKNDLEKKPHTCFKCSNVTVVLAKLVREKIYKNFIIPTVLVVRDKIYKYFFKTNHNNIDKGFFEIPNDALSILIGRGERLELTPNTNPESNNKNNSNFKLLIPDKYISRNHIKITIEIKNEKKLFKLIDTNSSNGTKINNIAITVEDEIYLNPKDLIYIGETVIEFCI